MNILPKFNQSTTYFIKPLVVVSYVFAPLNQGSINQLLPCMSWERQVAGTLAMAEGPGTQRYSTESGNGNYKLDGLAKGHKILNIAYPP